LEERKANSTSYLGGEVSSLKGEGDY
jgi:hypothetical protein